MVGSVSVLKYIITKLKGIKYTATGTFIVRPMIINNIFTVISEALNFGHHKILIKVSFDTVAALALCRSSLSLPEGGGSDFSIWQQP